MVTKTYCDKCGCIISSRLDPILRTVKHEYNTYELCDSCNIEFRIKENDLFNEFFNTKVSLGYSH